LFNFIIILLLLGFFRSVTLFVCQNSNVCMIILLYEVVHEKSGNIVP
jgi:hypothetical protein